MIMQKFYTERDLAKGHWSDWNYALSLTLGKYLTTTITEFNRIRSLVKLVFVSPLVPLGHFNVQSFKIRMHEFLIHSI